nr:hypothetical protein GCM10020063_007440 [Dactylosporangium thailandense]
MSNGAGAVRIGVSDRRREGSMSFQDKVQHKAEEAKGAAKDKVGDMTDDERLQAEGRSEQSSANVKQAGDKVKDAAAKAKDALS